MSRAAFTRCDAADYVRAVVHHLLCVERALFAGDALNDKARRLINKYAHLVGDGPAFRMRESDEASAQYINRAPHNETRVQEDLEKCLPVKPDLKAD